jgi:hypothetical protein
MDTRHERWIVSAKTDRSPFHRSCSLLQCFWICVGMCTSISSIKYILYQMYLYMYLHVYIIHILNDTYIYIYTYNIYIYVHTQVSTWSLYFYLCSISYPQLRQARSEFTSQNVASDVTWLVGGGESEPKWALAPWFYVVYTVYNIHMIIYI